MREDWVPYGTIAFESTDETFPLIDGFFASAKLDGELHGFHTESFWKVLCNEFMAKLSSFERIPP